MPLSAILLTSPFGSGNQEAPFFGFPLGTGVVDADAGGGFDLGGGKGRAAFFQPQAGGGGGGLLVLGFVDGELFGEASGASDALDSPEKDGGGVVWWSGDQIEEPMDAVAKIHIPVASGAKHDGIPRGFATVGVGGAVFEALINFDFGDFVINRVFPGPLPDEILPQNGPRDFLGGLLEKGGFEKV